jgi:hypothetical protein
MKDAPRGDELLRLLEIGRRNRSFIATLLMVVRRYR